MSRHSLIALMLCGLTVSACAQQRTQTSSSPSPSPASSPSPLPSASSTSAPVRSPAATPSAMQIRSTPTPGPLGVTTAIPSVTSRPAAVPSVAAPTVSQQPVVAANDPPPKILSIAMSESTVHSGDVERGRVVASPNTASVEARIGGYSMSLPKAGAGIFTLTYKVPWVPFFLHGKYDVLLIARNTEGVESRRTVRISVQ